jgi:hypothetical protein
MPYVNVSDRADNRRHPSRQRVHHQLTVPPPTTHLDYAVFHVAAFEYDIGIFVIYSRDDSEWFCERIRATADRHIVLYHARRHYECVQYDGQRLFSSDHAFVAAMSQFAAQHPAYPREDDPELRAVEAQEEKSDDATATMVTTEVAEPPAVDTPSTPVLLATPKSASARLSDKRATSTQRSTKSKAKRAIAFSDKPVSQASASEAGAASVSSVDGIKHLPPLIAQVAEHGPLYERVSFHNHPQWRAANEPLWNAYRLASMTGQRGQLTPILLDILKLPQRVLPKLGRSGRAARRRAVAGTGRRLRTEAQRLREQYNCPDPDPKDGQQTQMSTETMANTMAQLGHQRRTPQRVAAVVARGQTRKQAANTTDADSQRIRRLSGQCQQRLPPATNGMSPSRLSISSTEDQQPTRTARRLAKPTVWCSVDRLGKRPRCCIPPHR